MCDQPEVKIIPGTPSDVDQLRRNLIDTVMQGADKPATRYGEGTGSSFTPYQLNAGTNPMQTQGASMISRLMGGGDYSPATNNIYPQRAWGKPGMSGSIIGPVKDSSGTGGGGSSPLGPGGIQPGRPGITAPGGPSIPTPGLMKDKPIDKWNMPTFPSNPNLPPGLSQPYGQQGQPNANVMAMLKMLLSRRGIQ